MSSASWPSVTASTITLLLLGSLLTGCQSPSLSALSADLGCQQALAGIERQITRAKTQDAQAQRLDDLPYLRVNRFLASFSQQPMSGNQAREWLGRVSQLGLQGWRIEMANAGLSERQQQVGVSCALQAIGDLDAWHEQLTVLRQRAQVNDHYSLTKRTLGLYPFSRLPVLAGAEQVAASARARYSPQPSATSHLFQLSGQQRLTQAQIRQLMHAAYQRSALKIPSPTPRQLAQLFAHFAPQWALEVKTPADFTGRLQLDWQSQPKLNPHHPVVYFQPGYTRYRGQSLLQLSYTLWFAARPPDAGGKLYSGRFDGLIWRVTLSPSGQPLFYDSVHPCGCYHKVYSFERDLSRFAHRSEPVVLPLAHPSTQPVRVQIRAGDHYVTSVSAAEPVPTAIRYQLRPYHELRQLPTGDGGSASLFDRHGIVPSSERSERFVLWPMGIRSAGAMRQHGTLAVSFTGRRHFDDAYLFDALFGPEP